VRFLRVEAWYSLFVKCNANVRNGQLVDINEHKVTKNDVLLTSRKDLKFSYTINIKEYKCKGNRKT
jgi:hypothetical protein